MWYNRNSKTGLNIIRLEKLIQKGNKTDEYMEQDNSKKK